MTRTNHGALVPMPDVNDGWDYWPDIACRKCGRIGALRSREVNDNGDERWQCTQARDLGGCGWQRVYEAAG